MIPSAKNRWFSAWFVAQAYRRLQKSFGTLWVAGRDQLEDALAQGPVLVVSNHCSWWDPLMAMILTRRLVPADSFAMMDAKNLVRLPFFAMVGAFGVDRTSRRDGAVAIRYVEQLLNAPGRLVWIFAQGQERPVHERPLRFLGGAARVAMRNSEVVVVPVALSYGFGTVEAPSAYVSIGPPLRSSARASEARVLQAQAVEAELDRIMHELSQPGSQGFEVWPLRRATWWSTLAERMLAGLMRPFVPGLGEQSRPLALPVSPRPGRAVAGDGEEAL